MEIDGRYVALVVLLGYLLGSVPFGIILTRLAGAGDLRQIGSGNIGATNVLRTGHRKLAAFTLIFDLAKGLAAVLIGQAFIDPPALGGAIAGLAALIGHCFPVWLRFHGGKGVATYAGVALGVGWPVGLAFVLTWLGTLAATRISSLSGMMASLAAPVMAAVLGRIDLLPFLVPATILVIWLHRANIGRLRRGEEPRVGGR